MYFLFYDGKGQGKRPSHNLLKIGINKYRIPKITPALTREHRSADNFFCVILPASAVSQENGLNGPQTDS